MEMLSAEILNWLTHYGYLGIFGLLMLEIVGVPIPDELILTCAGYLIFKGYLSPGVTAASAFTGSVCGITVSYALGRFIGTPIINRYGYLVNIKHEMLDRLTAWYERFGKWGLILGIL
uniref:DedA family protein n=1 Tax=Anaerolinea thermolimosa TaxID=229919 RepID=A0A7C4PK81_9CHLR